MRAVRLAVSLGALSGLALSACGVPAAPPADDHQEYLDGNGAVRYDLLRQNFGAPNQNLLLNPRATDVAKTPSVASVTIAPDTLTFVASQAGWLTSKQPGDTLYCDHRCGGSGFLRKIVSIENQGDRIVVHTVNGVLTDVVWRGWLHAEVPFDSAKPAGTPTQVQAPGQPTSPGTPAPRAEGEGAKPASGGEEGDHNFGLGAELNIKGSVKVQPHFKGTVTVDMVVDWWSWTGPKVQLVKFEVTATPTLDMEAEAEAESSVDASWTFWDMEVPLGAFPVGPVEVTPTLQLELYGDVSASGVVTVSPSANISESLDYGFVYTKSGGAQVIDKKAFNHSESMTLTGEAGLTLSVGFDAGLFFKIYDIAGPQLLTTAELGAEVKRSTTKTQSSTGASSCKDELEGDFFFDLAGKVGVKIEVAIFSEEANLTLGEKSWTFPATPWTHEISDSASACPVEPDGGVTQGDGGTLGGGDGGAAPTCGNVTCGAQECCSFAVPGTCTSSVTDMLGGPCQADTDCNCHQSNQYVVCFQGTCQQGCSSTADCPGTQTCYPAGTNNNFGSCPSVGPGCCF